MKLGQLEEIEDLRTVWPHEALDFTPWLASEENITLLSDAIGIDINVEATEAAIGAFNVDILATEAETGRCVIIENQLEDTNHDHLGKLITYAAGKSACVMIWLVKHAREEHKAAIEWLNNNTSDDIGFFLCEIKLFRIEDSAPAVKFEVVERPNDWTKELKRGEGMEGNGKDNYEYWAAFNEYAFQNQEFAKEFRQRKPSARSYMDFSIGSSECHLTVSQLSTKEELIVELYINDDKELYRSFYAHKAEIEEAAGLKFDWREMPDRKASRVRIARKGNLRDRDKWIAQADWLIQVMLIMKRVFQRYI